MAKYADKIADDLVAFLGKQDCLVSKEFPINGFRSDVFCITKELLFIDFEIKTTIADYHNDFKKINKNGMTKHALFSYGALTNRLTFVMPPNLIPLDDIPHIYGVIYYLGDTFTQVRKGTTNNPLDPDEYYDTILEGATAKYTPELLLAFQKKFIEFLRFKILSTNAANVDLKWLCDAQEKEIMQLRDEIQDNSENNLWY